VKHLRPVFGTTTADILLLGSSGTGGLEAAIASTFSPGDKLLACPIGVFGRRLIAIAKTYGCEVDVVETDLGDAVDPQAIAERLQGGKRYAGILLTHNETSTGAQNDMAAIARAIKGFEGISIVDSVSGLAASDFRMDEWHYDIVISASQKALAAPPGVSMVAVSQRAWETIEKCTAPRFYFDLVKAREFAAQGQTPWTPPVSILFALDVALERYFDEGPEVVWQRHETYARAIRAAFSALGLETFSKPHAHSPTVVAARVPQGLDAALLLRKLREERGVVLSGGQLELKGKIVRMGTMGDISQTDVLGAMGAIEIALLESDVPVHVGTGVQAAVRVFMEAGGVTPGAAQSTGAQTGVQTTAGSR
jgi:aspartate aminotransferase-like enzyme